MNPAALRTAREALGWTQAEAAQRAEVPQPELSRWERGLRQANSEQIERLAVALQVPASFLLADLRLARPIHRTAKAETKRSERMVNARLELARIAASRLVADIEIAAPFDFPTAEDPTPPDPEAAAEAIRRVWRIPPGPINDLTAHVESAGGIVLRADFGVDSILAAYCHVRADARWCFLNVRAADGARARFSLAHEIGHAVLHWDRFDAPEGPDAEREAHRFAAALLMPAAEIRAMFARARLTLDDFVHARMRWRVSIQALVTRAYDLGLLSIHQRTRLWKQISARGWRRAEPGPIDLEVPSTFAGALELQRTEHEYSENELADVAGLPLFRLAEFMPDYFAPESSSNRAALRLIK